MWIQGSWSPNSTLSNRSTRFFLDSFFQLCVILVVYSEIQETLSPITAFGEGEGKEMQSFFCSCASCRARNMKPSVGPFPSFPFTNEVEGSAVNEAAQLWPGMQNGSNQAQGWGMVAMTLQSMHHAFHLWIVPFWLMTSCLSFHVSKCDNNIKQLRIAPTHRFSTVLEMLF